MPFPLRYRAPRAPGAGLQYLEQVKLLPESTRSVAGSCAPAAQRKGIEHLGPLPQQPRAVRGSSFPLTTASGDAALAASLMMLLDNREIN